MFGMTRSEKIYKGSKELENSPLISPSQESEEELAQFSLRSVVSLIK